MLNACYWIEWTIEFDNLCKKKKKINVYANQETLSKLKQNVEMI